MTDDRDLDHGAPEPTGPPDGYHSVSEGYGNVEFLDEDGKPMSRQRWLRMIEADEREPRYETPDGYFNVPEGRGQVVFHDEDGNTMTPEQFDRYMERKRREAGPKPEEQ